MSATWNTDIKSAPHGRYEIKQRREGVDVRVFVPERVVVATKCGKVTISHYQPEVKRWEMLADGELPVAWAPYTPGQKLPEHPNSQGGAAACAADSLAVTSAAPSGTGSLAKPLAEHDSTVGPALSEQVGAAIRAGSAARGQAASSGECPEAPPVEQSPQGTAGNSGKPITMTHQDIRA